MVEISYNNASEKDDQSDFHVSSSQLCKEVGTLTTIIIVAGSIGGVIALCILLYCLFDINVCDWSCYIVCCEFRDSKVDSMEDNKETDVEALVSAISHRLGLGRMDDSTGEITKEEHERKGDTQLSNVENEELDNSSL